MFRIGLLLYGLIFLLAPPLQAAPARLLKDIGDGPSYAQHSVQEGISWKGFTLFIGSDARYGYELWKTDGTTEGTILLKDIWPGSESSQISELTVSGDAVYFVADDSAHGRELWRTDGTPGGTHMVADIRIGPWRSSPTQLRAFQGGVIFAANVTNRGFALCHSTGSPETTRVVKVLSPNYEVEVWDGLISIETIGGRVCFSYKDPSKGYELWKSDGTLAGTALLKDIYPGATSSNPNGFTALGNHLYFAASDAKHGSELWRTDGTTAGTILVKDINEGSAGSHPQNFIVAGNQVYFSALHSSTGGFQLWRSDGTKAGTYRVMIAKTPQTSVAFKGQLYIIPREDPARLERVDGNVATPICTFPSSLSFLSSMIATEQRILLGVRTTTFGAELWSSDGTGEGTMMPRPSAEGGVSFGGGLVAGGDKVIFTGYRPEVGTRFWTSDGTVEGTNPFGPEIIPGASSDPNSFGIGGGAMLFSARNAAGTALWRTDGTSEGTAKIKKVGPNQGSTFTYLGKLNEVAFFSADDGESGRELWRSDGTSEGTVRVADIAAGATSSYPEPGIQLGSSFYFPATDPQGGGRELWRTDGTQAGTERFADLATGTASSNPRELTVAGGFLYFLTGNTLWRMDGTTPVAIVDRVEYNSMTVVGDHLFFTTFSQSAIELRRTVTTTPTTVLLKSFLPGAAYFDSLLAFENRLFFVVGDLKGSRRLWESDGTAAGTKPSPITQRAVSQLSVAGERFYFSIFDPNTTRVSLWQCDGSSSGLLLHPNISSLGRTFGDTQFFFSQEGGRLGLWKTNGRPENTEAVPNAWVSDAGPSAAGEFLNSRWLTFAGYTVESGREPYVLDLGGDLIVESIADTGIKKGAYATGDSVACGLAGKATPATAWLRLRNNGCLPLSEISVEIGGENADDFALAAVPPATLQAGEWFDMAITFTPQNSGERKAVLNINSDGVHQPSLVLELQGNGVTAGKPALLMNPPPQIAVTGQPVSLRIAFASDSPMTYTWRRGSEVVGQDEVLNLLAATPGHAGLYTLEAKNAFGFTTSAPLALVVMTAAPTSASVSVGSSITLTCNIHTPPGHAVSYRWLRSGLPITMTATGKTNIRATHPIKRFAVQDVGGYSCEASVSYGGLTVIGDNGSTEVTLLSAPEFGVISLPELYVGQPVQFSVPAINEPSRLSATGLPPGLTINTATGVVSGRPLAAKMVGGTPGAYEVRFTATNAAGTIASAPQSWFVRPLPVSGEVFALMDRHEALNSNLGGVARLTVTPRGACTGHLMAGATRHAFSAPVETAADGKTIKVTARLPRPRAVPIEVVIDLNTQTALVSGSMSVGADSAGLSGTVTAAGRVVIPPLAGYYTAALEPEAIADEDAYPNGNGFLTFTVTPKAIINWSGILSDGAAVSGSSHFGTLGQIGFHHLLYGRTGSIQGWLQATPDVEGEADWFKPPQTSATRSYKQGLPLHLILITGGRYHAPFSGQAVLGLPDAPPDNARITLAGGGLTDNVVQSFTVTRTNAVQMPSNERQIKISTLNAGTGLFTGSFVLTDSDPRDQTEPISNLKRSAAFKGVLVPRLGEGTGNFQLAELPTTPAASVNSTPLRSGRVTLAPETP